MFGAVVQAVLAGDAVRVRAELPENADPNVPAPIEEFTALHPAMTKGEVALMRALLAAGTDVRAASPLGTPRAIAEKEGHPAVAARFTLPAT